MPARETATGTSAWDDPVAAWPLSRAHRLLRTYGDLVNGALVARWLPDAKVGRLLKTDLFDEAVADGLYPVLRSRAERVYAVDISEATIAAARARYPELDAVRSDVRELPHPDGSFDVVVSNSTLDHFATLADLRTALAELRRVLVPGGVLVVTLDNPLNPLVAFRNALPFTLLRRLGLVQHPLGSTCGPRRLRAILAETGFRVTQTTAVMHVPRVLVLALARVRGERALRALLACEALAPLPTRYLTGQFVAARAVRA